jgi:cytochrome c-type biogenesis protein CcmH
MRTTRGLLLVSAVALSALAPRASYAQRRADTAVVRGWDDTEAQRLFGRLMSPFCRGLTLAQCPSPGADSLRQDIRSRLAHGETSRAITAAYVADWGEQMLGAPPVRDWGVLLWTLPGVLLLVGAAVLALWLLRLRRRAVAAEAATAEVAPESPPMEPALRQRLEAELEAFEKGR